MLIKNIQCLTIPINSNRITEKMARAAVDYDKMIQLLNLNQLSIITFNALSTASLMLGLIMF